MRVLKRDDSACLGFTITSGSTTRQVTFPRIASGRLVVSTDGRTVVMIESYLPAVVKAKKVVEALYDDEIVLNPKVLRIYRDGVRVAAYDLPRLVKHLGRVTQSISHIRWVESAPTKIDRDTFTIITTTKREIVFDTRTGKIVDERDR